ncbi:T9SS type A sorting domain-containing protein [Chryseolinea lacunae]|uniref:Fibronectin type III domain-containing protein n=1 Tax=Chryseolinea lacunae TaxID=2801331 RepID=A0ABS1L2W7_9BACT|nr:fibronectin type III domain-containing protein [Chryseolinea lacunae]MBL0745847.1 fibronectin type III domain-containing protein [Chryseolinea lacunae]
MLRKLVCSVALLMSVVSISLSQSITSYTFTSSNGSFSSISGGVSPGGIGTADEGYFNGIPIGFDFWYMGTRYTTLSASTNGWLTLGANISTATPTDNLSGGDAPRPVLAPLWDNLELSPATKVSYVTTGSAGSRIFTLQCLNVKWTTGASGNTISFQTRLYENSGKIEFIYRPESGTANAPSASIGIAATATGSGNFLSVNNAGSSVSSTAASSVTSKPSTGKTYGFAAPVPAAPSTLTFSSISSTGMTLNWVDLSSNETGFVIYRSTDGVTYTFNAQTAANAVSSTQSGLTANTTYYWKVQAVTEGALSSAISGNQTTFCTGSPSVTATATETCVGGSTGTITAAATGGAPPYTYSLNGGGYQSSPVFAGLAAATYTLNVLGTSGCVSSISVTVNSYANSTDDQNATALGSWVGHVYDGISFGSYVGHYTETENFNESFGGALTCFDVTSGATTRSIYTESFSVKYRMTSTKRGLYVVDLGSDDGNRLTVDGTLVFNSFTYQSFANRPSVLLNLNGASALLYEYFESNGSNQAMFQNLTSVFSNTLSTNLVQSVCVGNAASAISGNTFGTLPSGIFSPAYQWSYSTTAGGARTNLPGATSATFTPSTAASPFNVPGTYYVYRNASLTSLNNVSPFPFVATNESNAATVVINASGQWTGSVSTDWATAGNWCTGVVPTATTNVVIGATAVRMPSITTSVTSNNLTLDAGVTLTIGATGTLNISGTFTNNGIVANTGTVNFNGTSGPQIFSGLTSFYNLTVSNPGGLLLPNAITVNNNVILAAGTLNTNNFNMVVKGNWTNNASTTGLAAGSSTLTFNGTGAQTIGGSFATTFNNVVAANTLNTVTLASNVSVAGDLTVSSGTLDLALFTADRATAGGILSVANNATLRIGGTNTYPANYATSTLVVASTVEYAGTNQTVSNQLYGNLLLSSAGGAVVKTFPATPLTIVGNLSTTTGSGTSVTVTAASALIVGGNVSIGASTTCNGGAFSLSVGGHWTTLGTFNGDTGTVTFTGSGIAVSGSGLQNFHSITVTGSGIVLSSPLISLSGNLATTGSGSTVSLAGTTLQMTGAGATLGGGGISLENLSIAGTVTTASSLTLHGNLLVSGSLTASAGSITMSGATKTISGAGTMAFSTLSISGAVTATSDFSIASALSVNGTLSATAGTAVFTGTSTLSGTANLFDVTLNGTTLTLSANSVLGVARVLAVTSGVMDVASSAPNTVDFNGAGPQNVNGLSYDNLTLSGGNSKTAVAALSVFNTLTIGAGTTFLGGAFTHSIYNDWVNNGTFVAGAGTVQFLGTSTSSIIGATTFNILTVNHALASTELTLASNVSAATVNMTNGTLLTGSNTLTITTTRTGNGDIYGFIQRTHAFTTGVAYAFKNPENSITFAAVSGVTSITVFVTDAEVADFPFGGSAHEEYDITVPAGTYTATLRLSYDDDELNGNNEASMGLWHYNGSAWVAVGKSGNSTTANYVERSGLTSITNRWTFSDNANVVEWNGSVSNAWNTAANWTVVQGSASRPPSALDIVALGNISFTNQPTISTAASTNNIIFGSAKAVVLTVASGGSLTTSGNIAGNWNASVTHTINLNNQDLTVNGDLILSDGVNGQAIDLTIGLGTVNIDGVLTESGGANITFVNAGVLNLHGDFVRTSGTFAAGTGTVAYVGNANQDIANVAYNDLVIDKTAGLATINSAVAIGRNVTVTAGELDNHAATTIAGNVTIAPGGILDNSNTLTVGGDWLNNGSFVANGGQEIFDGAGAQSISSSTFNDLVINKPVGTTATLTGNIAIHGDLTVASGTFDIKTFDSNRTVQGGTITLAAPATFIVGANNSPLNFSNGTLDVASTVIANGVNPQFIFGLEFGNLIFRNGGLKTLVSPINVKGTLTIESGATFDGGAETLTLNGNWVNNGTYIPSAGTTLQSGVGKTISGNTTFNKVIISGSYSNLADITYNDVLHITSTGSIVSGAGIFTTLNGDLINNGILNTLGTTTFTGNVQQTLSLINAVSTVALIVNFNGSVSPVLNSTSTPQYGFLNINNTGGVNPSVDWTILYALTVGSGASFNAGVTTQTIYGSLTNNGIITSLGVLNFIPASPVTLNMGSNFSSAGLVNFGGSGAITLAGTPVSFRDVLVSNTHAAGITPSSPWTIANNFTVNSGTVFHAGALTYDVGGNISNRGMLNRGTSVFILHGTALQDVYSVSAFQDVTINNSAGVATLSSSVSVNGVLNFIAGRLQTGHYTLTQPATGSVVGASQATGWVQGNLQKYVATGAPTQTFEVGDAILYAPVSTTFASVTSAGSLVASSTAGEHPAVNASGIDPSKSVNRYWTLTNNGIVFTQYDATFNFAATDVDAGANSAAFGIQEYDGSSWSAVNASLPNPTNIQANGITASGDFAIGEICHAGTAIAYALTPYCSSGGTASVTATGTTGGTYSSAPGLSIDGTSGDIALGTSAAGQYTVTYTIPAAGSCLTQAITTTLEVTSAPVATIGYAGSPYTVAVGTAPVTFSGTPGGSYSSTPGLSIESTTGEVTLNTSLAGSYTVAYTIAALGGCPLYSTTALLVLVNNLKTWDGGALTTNWSDANNWNPNGEPTALDDIALTGPHTINVDGAGLVNHLTLNHAGLVLTLNAGNPLTISGNLVLTSGSLVGSNGSDLLLSGDWINNGGTFTANGNTVVFSGTGVQNMGGSAVTDFHNITITNTANPGVRVESDQHLGGVLTLGSNVFFDADGSNNTAIFTLISSGDDPTQDAAVAILPAGAQINGAVTVQRFMSQEGVNNSLYRYIASPVERASVADIQNEIPIMGSFTGSSVCTGCGRAQTMFLYNESVVTDLNRSGVADLDDGYVDFPSSAATETLVPGRGYPFLVKGNLLASTLWDVRGRVNTGNVTPVIFPVSFTSSTVVANDGWNLVGNPFPSTIDWNAATGWTKTNVDGTVYVSDNDSGVLQYSTWNGVTGTNGGSRYIAPGQGFWTKADGAGAPVLEANEHVKVAGTQTIFFREGTIDNLLRVTLTKGALKDETVVHFRDDATPAFNNRADAWKLMNGSVNVASYSSDHEKLAINSWSTLECKATVLLALDNLKEGSYELIFSNRDSFEGDVGIWLVDAYTHDSVAIGPDYHYPFVVGQEPASKNSGRFRLQFEKPPVPVPIHEADGVFSVDATRGIQWYFNDVAMAGATTSTIVPGESGNYGVTVLSNGCERRGARVFTVTDTESALRSGIKIYPNPTTGVFYVETEQPITSIAVTNTLGMVVKTVALPDNGLVYRCSFDIHEYASGMYVVHLMAAGFRLNIKIAKE